MIIFMKRDGALRGTAYPQGPTSIGADNFQVTPEAGDSFEINTPLGAIQVERTQDTLSITC